MWHFIASLILSVACLTASISANSLSYLADDFALTYGIFTILCLIFFLLGIAVTILVNTSADGKLHSPRSLSALVCMLLLIPQGGFAIGLLVNYKSSLEIMMATQDSPGESVYSNRDLVVLDGYIGHETLSTFREILNQKSFPLLLLRSEGGLIGAGIEIGEILNNRQMDVLVTENCESACVIVALSGTNLFVDAEASFGFHRASATAGNSSQLGRFIGDIATEELLTALDALGVPDSILKIAEQTSPSEMYYVSGYEMVRLGLARDQSELPN